MITETESNLLLGFGVDRGVNLLKFLNGTHSEHTDGAGNQVGGFWGVVLVLLHLTEDLLELLNLLLGWDGLEWIDLDLVSLLIELLNELLIDHRVNDILLWSGDLQLI